MTTTEAFKRAVEVAVRNGWLGVVPKKTKRLDITETDMETRVRITYMLPNSKKVETYEQFIFNSLLLNPLFLKALFGEESIIVPANFMMGVKSIKSYNYHAHAMLDYVLEGKDPLEYLVKYFEGREKE